MGQLVLATPFGLARDNRDQKQLASVLDQSTYKLNLGPIGQKMRPESCGNQNVDGRTDAQTR